ncbi:hypothetical protein D0T49_03510 [Paludibacter sp. 221]|uniref:hypothetical protein n=1 Tax=Paludibacter sp. 221 TaxID=2302939 RepID=UPI0013D2B274|nr:hypothetical protein [Paludibacter sp. 221]NDV46108.1 hypothetical protein [Paludibacter sp. 221]
MALPLAAIPAIANIAQTAYGAVKEGEERKRMQRERNKWNAENEALFNKDYYSDYLQTAEAQNVIRQMRENMKRQSKAEQNNQVVTGATPEVAAANKEMRNRAVADLYGNLAARGQLRKDRAQDRYLSRKYSLQGLEYDTLGQQAQSANNMLYNGIKGLGNADWSSIINFGNNKGNNNAIPQAGSDVNYDYTPSGGNGISDPNNGTSLA